MGVDVKDGNDKAITFLILIITYIGTDFTPQDAALESRRIASGHGTTAP